MFFKGKKRELPSHTQCKPKGSIWDLFIKHILKMFNPIDSSNKTIC